MSKLAEGYWALIADAFDTVSVYDGHRVYADHVSRYAPHIRHLLAAHWCQSEVCNGGFTQFFANSTGVLAEDAIVGLREIGLVDIADVVQSATARFGRPYPTDRAARRKKLRGGFFTKKVDCSDLDDRFFELLEKHGSFDKAATAYAERHV